MSNVFTLTQNHVDAYRKDGYKWGAYERPYLTVKTKDHSGEHRLVMVDARDDGLYFCCSLGGNPKVPHFRKAGKAESLAKWMSDTLTPYWHLRPSGYAMPDPEMGLDEIEKAQEVFHELQNR